MQKDGKVLGMGLRALRMRLTVLWFGGTLAVKYIEGKVCRLSSTLTGGLGGKMSAYCS